MRTVIIKCFLVQMDVHDLQISTDHVLTFHVKHQFIIGIRRSQVLRIVIAGYQFNDANELLS